MRAYQRAVRIPPRLLRSLFLRGTLVWFLVRLAVAGLDAWVAAAGGSESQVSVAGTRLTSLWIIPACMALLMVDFRRRKETMLLRNLGIAPAVAAMPALAPSVLMEIAWLVLR